MDLLQEGELEALEQNEVIAIINKFLDGDILPMKYFESLFLQPRIVSKKYSENDFSRLLSFQINTIPCQVEAKQTWRLLSRNGRAEILKDLIMQDMNSEHISEELKNIFGEGYNPIMDNLILNHLNDDGEFNL